MKKDLVVKTNRLNQAFQTLSLAELHIVQLAIVDARETGTGLSTDTPLRIDAKRYAEVFDTTRQNAYQRMKEAEDTLFNRRFSFYDEEGMLVKSRWISQVRYLDDQGAIEVVFTPAVVQGISRIDGVKEFFTQYLLSQTAHLKSVYSARLYELLIQWRSTGKVPTVDLMTFREQLGVGVNEYQRMHHFKVRVLDLAVNEINEKTDINVQYDQHKEGRLIKGFSFTFKHKQPVQNERTSLPPLKDPNTLDMFHRLTEKQLDMFSSKLADLPTVQAMAHVGEDMKPFVARLRTMLMDTEQQKALLPYLKEVGYAAA
jgi:plasmid replication initiation protein